MLWERSYAIGLAKASCTFCHGNGMRPVYNGTEAPCNCVFRAVFRACYRRFQECAAMGTRTGSVDLEFCGGQRGYRMYSRKREEFMADFCLVSSRTLDGFDHRIFRHHYLLGADWKLCCRELKVDRGCYFHTIYRIQTRLGRVFAELQPYPLFPLDEYFGNWTQRIDKRPPAAERISVRGNRQPVPLPLSA